MHPVLFRDAGLRPTAAMTADNHLLGRNPLLRWTGSVMPNGTVRSNPSPTIGGRGRQ
jgi:hypothetical protein